MNSRGLSLLILAFVLVLPNSVIAQMGIVRGQVVDQDGKPVSGASVTFDFLGELNRKFETETNEKGRYTQVVNSGRYRITAAAEGYRASYIEERISSGPTKTLPNIAILNVEVAQERAFAPILEKFEEAAALSKAGKIDEALAVYDGLRTESEENAAIPELHFNMANLHARKQDWPAAEAAFRKTLELVPEQTSAALALASVIEHQGRSEEAEALLQGLADSNPDDADVLYELALAMVNADRPEEAKAVLEKVVALDPKRAEAEYLLARIALNAGETESAIGHLERYLEFAPPDAEFRDLAEKIITQLKPAQ